VGREAFQGEVTRDPVAGRSLAETTAPDRSL